MTITFRHFACAVLLGVLVAGGARAGANLSFDPELTFAYGYNDNVSYGGDPVGSDTILRLDLDLPLMHRWKTGELTLSYSPRILRYDTFSGLDRVDQYFDYRLTSNPSRKGLLDIRVDASFKQVQGAPESDDPSEAFISQRTDRDTYRGDVLYRQGFASEWRWSALASSRLYRFTPVGPPSDPDDPNRVEDRDVWLLAFQIDRQLSNRTFVGGRYERSEFKLELSGEAETDALLFSFERKLDRKSDLGFTVGAFTTKGTAVDATAQTSDRTTGVQGEATYSRRFREVLFRVRAGHRPSAGGALLGAIRYSWVQVSLVHSNAASAWRWSVIPRWALRDPLIDQQPNRQTWSLGGTVTRRLNEQLGVRLRSNYIKQVSNVSTIADREVLTTEIGIVWAPWHGTRMAQR